MPLCIDIARLIWVVGTFQYLHKNLLCPCVALYDKLNIELEPFSALESLLQCIEPFGRIVSLVMLPRDNYFISILPFPTARTMLRCLTSDRAARRQGKVTLWVPLVVPMKAVEPQYSTAATCPDRCRHSSMYLRRSPVHLAKRPSVTEDLSWVALQPLSGKQVYKLEEIVHWSSSCFLDPRSTCCICLIFVGCYLQEYIDCQK
jgi:hypothetical protein